MNASTFFKKPFQTDRLGATVHAGGVFFRVWAPNAKSVHVVGAFNNWKKSRGARMHAEGNGHWALDVPRAKAGEEYRFLLETPWGELWRNDPYARQVQHSNGNGVVYDPAAFDWGDDSFELAPWNRLAVYELHIGTFHVTEEGRPGTFDSALEKLPYLSGLGINAVEVMPPAEFPGDYSWGYNPAHPFAIETSYGGPDGFKNFVKTCHAHGIGVILDVVYNHFGPNDLDIWRFDGWSEHDGGGIYFYNDWRGRTPWGHTRPDYGRPEVRRYIRDNALMWLEEYRVDGLRFDMTPYIRTVDASEDPGNQLPDGLSLLRDINAEIRTRYPGKITIAEDMHGQDFMTDPGGGGFGAQWDSRFVHPVREALITAFDDQRDLNRVVEGLLHRYNNDAFRRVIYTESHDEVSNGRARVAEDIAPGEADSWFAMKRSTLGAALLLTAPGIPMLFQGQAMHEDGWFVDTNPLDWSKEQRFGGIIHLYTDLIALRLDRTGGSAGLTGQHAAVLHADHVNKLLAYYRWDGPADPYTAEPGVVVILNFSIKTLTDYELPLPREGQWQVRFNSDWDGYNEQFSNHLTYDPVATNTMDGAPRGRITIAPYTALILTMMM
jgi:1,4-alpha-glucan branching enzyme